MITGLLVFLAPILTGVSGVLLPASGYFPALGFSQFSTHPALSFFATPGVGTAIWLALKTGLIASCLSLLCCFIILTGLMHYRGFAL